jgi:hypothetical protein
MNTQTWCGICRWWTFPITHCQYATELVHPCGSRVCRSKTSSVRNCRHVTRVDIERQLIVTGVVVVDCQVMGYPAKSSENSSTDGGMPESRMVTLLRGCTSLINRHSPGFFFSTRKYRLRYGPCEYSSIPLAELQLLALPLVAVCLFVAKVYGEPCV